MRSIYANVLIPNLSEPVENFIPELYEGKINIGPVLGLKTNEADFAKILPNARNLRSMSRAAMMLSAVCLGAKDIMDPLLSDNPAKMGIYAALDTGPLNFAACKKFVGIKPEDYADQMKKWWPPKQLFHFCASLAASHVGILLGAMGPIVRFKDTASGVALALEQAVMDLEAGRIEFAAVCAAQSFEDPLQVYRLRKNLPSNKVLVEGAAVIILSKNKGRQFEWDRKASSIGNNFFGIADPLIVLAMKEAQNAQ